MWGLRGRRSEALPGLEVHFLATSPASRAATGWSGVPQIGDRKARNPTRAKCRGVVRLSRTRRLSRDRGSRHVPARAAQSDGAELVPQKPAANVPERFGVNKHSSQSIFPSILSSSHECTKAHLSRGQRPPATTSAHLWPVSRLRHAGRVPGPYADASRRLCQPCGVVSRRRQS